MDEPLEASLDLHQFGVSLSEMPSLGAAGTEAAIITRKNSALAARNLTAEQFGYLVDQWNSLNAFQRMDRADYCKQKKHDWRGGPYDGGKVCARCLKMIS